MLNFLRILGGLVSLANALKDFYARWKMRKEVTDAVVAEIKTKEAEIAKASAETLNEHRPDGAARKRLRDGSF